MLFISVTLSSCKQNLQSYLIEDGWIIKEYRYNQEDLTPLLSINLINFNKSNKCDIPFLNGYDNNKDFNTEWYFDKEKSIINIKSNNHFFNGKFELCLKKDYELKKVYMVLKSDSIYIKAYKGIGINRGFDKKLPIKECEN